MKSYDLITEPWIAAINREGEVEEMGLKPLLLRAHELRELRDPVPTAEMGLYRLLIALVLDIHRPEAEKDIKRLLGKGRFELEAIENYFDGLADRFDLFHPKQPFLQSPSAGQPDQPLALLHFAIPAGTNANHFHHQSEDDFVLSPAAAARLLTTVAPFMTMGGAGLSPSVNGAPPWYVLATGENLFETLLLNSAPPVNEQIKLGEPAWRRDGDVPAGPQPVESLLQVLTWQPRRILFEPGDGGLCSLTGRKSPLLVRRMAFKAGAKVDEASGWAHDPQVAYRKGKDDWIPLRPMEEREVWRDTGTLTHASRLRDDGDRAPAVLEQASRFLEEEGKLCISLYGMRTDLKTKVFEWQREQLDLPIQILWDSPVHNRLRELMEFADRAAWTLGKAIELAYPRGGKGAKKPFGALVTTAKAEYWRALRGSFPDLLNRVTGDLDEARSFWHDAATGIARDCLHRALDPLDADWRSLERVANARRYFYGQIFKLKNPNAKKGSRSAKQPASATTGANE